MESKLLFRQLDRDFILPCCSDNWSEIHFNEFYTESYKQRYMGLVLDNTNNIKSIYTAVFPSEKVLNYLFDNNIIDSLLFTHHPMAWDITKTPIFSDIRVEHLQLMKDRRISLYNLHVPLDRNSDYSTSVNLAHAVGANVLDGFYDYFGCKVAVIAKVPFVNISELKVSFEKAIGHESKLYLYGEDRIENNLVAFCGGGGNQPELYEFLASKGINAYVTGITSAETGYLPAIKAHENAKKYNISILGGTHYSTEKFACIKIKEYFMYYKLMCEFIEDDSCFADM